MKWSLVCAAILILTAMDVLAQEPQDGFGSVSAFEEIQHPIPIGLSNITLGGNGEVLTVTLQGNGSVFQNANKTNVVFTTGDIGSLLLIDTVLFNETYLDDHSLSGEPVTVYAGMVGKYEILMIFSAVPELQYEDQTKCGGMYEVSFKRKTHIGLVALDRPKLTNIEAN